MLSQPSPLRPPPTSVPPRIPPPGCSLPLSTSTSFTQRLSPLNHLHVRSPAPRLPADPPLHACSAPLHQPLCRWTGALPTSSRVSPTRPPPPHPPFTCARCSTTGPACPPTPRPAVSSTSVSLTRFPPHSRPPPRPVCSHFVNIAVARTRFRLPLRVRSLARATPPRPPIRASSHRIFSTCATATSTPFTFPRVLGPPPRDASTSWRLLAPPTTRPPLDAVTRRLELT